MEGFKAQTWIWVGLPRAQFCSTLFLERNTKSCVLSLRIFLDNINSLGIRSHFWFSFPTTILEYPKAPAAQPLPDEKTAPGGLQGSGVPSLGRHGHSEYQGARPSLGCGCARRRGSGPGSDNGPLDTEVVKIRAKQKQANPEIYFKFLDSFF